MDFLEGLQDSRTSAGAEFSKSLSTKEGIAIVEAMLRIKTQAMRRAVIDIAEKLCGNLAGTRATSHA
jgi:hypothetical protein